jgi:hypothetical protein
MLGLPVFWSAFEDLDHSLRTGDSAFAKRHPGGVFEYLAKHPQESRIFDSAMTSKSHRDIAAILPAYDFSQFATIADIAGGRGHLLRAVLKSFPTTQGILFDQPHVVAEVSPVPGQKLSVVSGNFFADPMPQADAYLLMNIIHDWADAESIKILSAIRRDMPRHACVLIIETVVPETPGPHLSKELDIAMMALPGGKERTQEESGLGRKMWPQIETNNGNQEPLFDPGDGGRLSWIHIGVMRAVGVMRLSRQRRSSAQHHGHSVSYPPMAG